MSTLPWYRGGGGHAANPEPFGVVVAGAGCVQLDRVAGTDR